MKNKNKLAAVLLILLMAIVALTPTTAFAKNSARNFKAGAVYVLTNQINNGIAVFTRDTDCKRNVIGDQWVSPRFSNCRVLGSNR